MEKLAKPLRLKRGTHHYCDRCGANQSEYHLKNCEECNFEFEDVFHRQVFDTVATTTTTSPKALTRQENKEDKENSEDKENKENKENKEHEETHDKHCHQFKQAGNLNVSVKQCQI